jgi:hypothetical protein
MRFGFDGVPLALVLVRCRRCHRPAGLFCADASGTGAWRKDHHRRCRCDPPPQLPNGTELDRLVAQARRGMRSDGRAAVSVSR